MLVEELDSFEIIALHAVTAQLCSVITQGRPPRPAPKEAQRGAIKGGMNGAPHVWQPRPCLSLHPRRLHRLFRDHADRRRILCREWIPAVTGMGSAAWSDELAAIAGGSTWQAFIAEVSAKMDAAWLQDAPTPDVLGLWVAHRKAKLIGG